MLIYIFKEYFTLEQMLRKAKKSGILNVRV